MSPDKCCGPRG